jgi:hypothetical protein
MNLATKITTSMPRASVAKYAFLVSLVALALSLYWLRGVLKLELGAQRELVVDAVAWGLNGCVVLGLGGIFSIFHLVRVWISQKMLLQAVILAAIALGSVNLAPRTHRIFFDEQIYMQIGQTYAHTGRLLWANYARAEHGEFEFYTGELNKQPQGWPYVYGQIARWTGVSPNLGQLINNIAVCAATVILFFALSFSPWRLPKYAPFMSALFFALTPMVAFWGNTAAVEPMAATSVTGVLLACMIYVRLRESAPISGHLGAALFLAAFAAFACYFRPESLFVFPFVAVVLWADEDDFVHDYMAWFSLLLALILILPNLAQLWAVRAEDWGASDGRRFDIDFFLNNLKSNGGYFLKGNEFPLTATLFSISGLIWSIYAARGVFFVLLAWLIPAWGTFLLFYAGGYHYGASNRFAVLSSAPVAIFAGIGAAFMLSFLSKRRALLGIMGGLTLINWSKAMVFVSSRGREAYEAQEESNYVAVTARDLPAGSLVISQVPSLWLINNRNSAAWWTISGLAESNLHELVNQYPGGIYIHYGYWENVEIPRADAVAKIILDFSAEEISRRPCFAMTFAIYKLNTSAALQKFGGRLPDTPARRESDLDLSLERARDEFNYQQNE